MFKLILHEAKYKQCRQCKIIKSAFYFSPSNQNVDGLKSYCKSCNSKNNNKYSDTRKIYREKNRDRAKDYKINYYNENKDMINSKNKEWQTKNKEKYDFHRAEWARQNKQKRKAHGAVNYAIASGKLKRECCSICGAKNAEAHHPDYSKSLCIVWLCTKHHAEHHRFLRQKER